MRVKRLELHGFKTFVGRTDLIVHPGVTAIVGPNGSGKSNIVDALRWSLGEQSLSAIRCRKTEDLIFVGSAGRSQTGMAEAALSLDNSDRYLDLDYTEVTVARRAYRSGENEYLVNRGRVRLKDLVELVAPMRPSQAFVGQGQVDAMLSLHADERRRLIEDAAQLGLYKLRKAEAEHQLSRVKANAVRVRDLLADLEPRLRSLKRQARRTEARRVLESRLAGLTRSFHLRRLQSAFSKWQADMAKEQAIRDTLAQTNVAFEERLCVAEGIAAELQAAESELSSHDEERRRMSTELAHIERFLNERREVAAGKKAALQEADLRLSGLRRELERIVRRRTEVDLDLARRQSALADNEKSCRVATEKRVILAAAVEERETSLNVARERRDALARRLKEAQHSLHQAEGDLRELRERQRAAKVRQELAREAQESYSGYPRAVQQLMSARSNDKAAQLSGLIGTIGELIEVPKEIEMAVETALGGHMFDIVARRWEDAEGAIEYLKTQRLGRCTFLPLDTVPRAAVQPVPKSPGLVGLAFDLVKFDPTYTNVFAQLLGRVIVVDDLPSAHRLLAKTRPGYVLVTLTGEVVRMTGSITGGHVVNSRLLGRVRESREGEEELRVMQRRVETALASLERLAGQVSELEAETSAALQGVQKAEADSNSARSSLSQLEDALLLEEKECGWIQSLVKRLEDERAELDREDSAVVEQIYQAESDCARIRSELDEYLGEETGFDSVSEEASRAANSAELELAALESRLDRRLALLPVHKANVEKLDARLQDRRSHFQAIHEQISLSEAGQLAAEDRIASLQDAAAQAENACKPLAENIRRLRAQAGQLDDMVSTLRDSMMRAEEDLRQASIEVERSRGEVRHEEGQTDPGGYEPGRSPEDPYAEMDLDYLQAEVESCRLELEQMGPVNWMAEEEHQEAEGRYSFLDGQLRDLAAAEKTLEDLIAELEQNAEQRFMDTFQVVAAEFSTIFTQLFLGGSAELRLLQGPDGQSAGVDIFVQPPGKRSQNLSLLSGGERALSSIALLFAMLKASPSPFYVLDEVDAALDESNVRRFASLLRQLAVETQFIVITHNRATIEASDIMYGVFMSDNSTSRLLSLSMSEAEGAINRRGRAGASLS
ncbi:MAG: AAA family ATPase [Chloroflexi bacterium]|nr:AAA family ATPase [Chloroflexota bacterium]